MSNQADIIAAIAQIAEDADGVLSKKPNVDEVEALTGFDVSAAERDEAWGVFNAPDAEVVADDESPVVTNNMASSLCIFDVTIPSKGSAAVPKFNADKPVIAAWLDAELISVE